MTKQHFDLSSYVISIDISETGVDKSVIITLTIRDGKLYVSDYYFVDNIDD